MDIDLLIIINKKLINLNRINKKIKTQTKIKNKIKMINNFKRLNWINPY